MAEDDYYSRRGLRGLARDVRWALVDKTDIPFGRRLRATRAGFKPESAVAYDFVRNDSGDYLPDTCWRRLSETNGPAARGVLANKLLFYLNYHRELPLPAVHAFIAGGEAVPVAGAAPLGSLERALDHLRERGALVVKPMGGDRGRGVHLVEAQGGEYLKDGRPLSREELLEFLRGRDGSLLVEKVQQADYANTIFPGSTNSLRLNVFGGAGTGYEPFLAVAGHRFGRTSSMPVDNTSKGGLICPVDTTDGRLGKGRMMPKHASSYVWFDQHPDTGAQLTGVEVPGFAAIVETLLDFSRRHPYLAYVGWDVVKTETGFVVLEANHHASLRIQVAWPFLKDPRIVAFLAHHGVHPIEPQPAERGQARRQRVGPRTTGRAIG